jgi:hypothetical protein
MAAEQPAGLVVPAPCCQSPESLGLVLHLFRVWGVRKWCSKAAGPAQLNLIQEFGHRRVRIVDLFKHQYR